MSGMTHQATRKGCAVQVWLYGRSKGWKAADKVAKQLAREGETLLPTDRVGNYYVFICLTS